MKSLYTILFLLLFYNNHGVIGDISQVGVQLSCWEFGLYVYGDCGHVGL